MLTDNSIGNNNDKTKKMRNLSKAFDLDSDLTSHDEILEHIRRNMKRAEEDAKNKAIVESMKITMDQF